MKKAITFTKESLLEQCETAGVSLPYAEDLSPLAETADISGHVFPNRLACQAMEGCDGTADGRPDELTKRRYRRFAEGGAGLIWFEATAVMREGRANPRQLWITEDNLDSFKREVEEIKEIAMKKNGYAPVVVMQATHSGRYSKPDGVPAPLIAYHSPIFEKDHPISDDRIVTDEYLDRVGEALVNGARLAEKAGFDGVDIKACHRYLNCELLSAFTRPGHYGGSFENRTRLLRESVAGARQVCSENFLVSTRMNAYDGFPYPYGFGVTEGNGIEPDFTEAKDILRMLSSLGVKLVNITMGNPYFNPHVNRPYVRGGYEPEEAPIFGVARMLNGTAELKKAVPEMKLICSGLSYLGTSAPHVVSAFVKDGGFDFAGFGRTIFAYPDFARDILSGGMKKEKCCIACSKCTEIMRTPGGTPGCAIRDPLYTELYRKIFSK